VLKAQEAEIVQLVAVYVESMFGVVPGPWTERDGKDDSGLTVDVTFEEANPPPRFAVEVTRLRDDFETSWKQSEVKKLQVRIRAFVKAKGWAGCSVGLQPETSFKAGLAPAIETMIEWMDSAALERLGPGSWSPADVSMDLFARIQKVKGRDFVKECRDARVKGVIQVQRLSTDAVLVIPVQEFSNHRSLQRPLARAFEDKASRSLGAAKDRGYVTMLAVDVERSDTAAFLAEGVRAPDFPRKIDHLWVFVRGGRGDLAAAFYANRTRAGRKFQALALPAE
jgi:hypothetical protein